MSASVLDSPDIYARLDPTRLYDRIAGLPEQIKSAWAASRALPLPEAYGDAERVVVLGMGGSGVGGGLVQALAVDVRARVPVSVVRGYGLPAYVDERTLVLASSNSGNTEETVTAFESAVEAGAMCVAITTGGKLGELADKHDIPSLGFEWQGEPRSALGWSTASLLAICGGLGLLPDLGADLGLALEAMQTLCEECSRDVPEAGNPAKELARRFQGKLAVIIGAQALAPVAYRWRTQINENAKAWAVADELPEMNHNAPLGFGAPRALLPLLHVVLLRHASMHPRIVLRVEATLQQLHTAGVAAEVVHVPGPSILAQMLWAIQLGDFMSYYLGLLHGVDPSPMGALEWIKSYMAAHATPNPLEPGP
ncbi:MAG: bifunctional phosphoglucose/phosphomannose isomerase [Chloroflexota bacterium]|nr:bifunctional phosphoglucose/phosphomannose isomerase [Chloroflexota bacterium]